MKRAAKKLLLVSAGALVGCLLAELLLRAMGISFPLPYLPDRHAGWRLQPGFSAWFGKEGRAFLEINREGFRDVDHVPAKSPNTVRIAVLGDSYAEAAQVSLSETFWSVFGKRLESCAAMNGRKIEVLNFGVSGYGTAQELQVLRQYVWKYDPDIVLLAFFSGNDLRNNSLRLEAEQARPFFRLEQDGLVLDDSFQQHPDYLKAHSKWTRLKVWLINHSRLLQLLNEIKSNRQRAAPTGSEQPRELGVDDLCFVEPRSDDWREAWEVTERLLAKMAEEARQHSAQLCVVTVTSGVQIDPDPLVRSAYQERLNVPDLFYAERRVKQLGERERFQVVILGPSMQEVAHTEHQHLHGFTNTKLGTGHWNVDGHRVAGELIAQEICREWEEGIKTADK